MSGSVRRTESEEAKRAEFGGAAEGMHRRLRAWRRSHPEATFDEIAEQVRQERQVLMGGLLSELALGTDVVTAVPLCPTCGGKVQNKGRKSRQVLHREGEMRLEREYYYCPACKQGFPPSGPKLGIDSSRLEPGDDSDGAAAGG
jgi:hypothetical protein